MANRIRNLSFTLFALYCVLFLQAEEPPPLREFQFHVVSGSRIQNVRYGVFDETGQLIGSKPTGFRSSGRSLKYPYKGPEVIVFFEEEPAPTAQNPNAVSRTTVAATRVPKGVEEVMFLFSENKQYPEKGLKYDIQWVDTSEKYIVPGHVTIYNTLPIEFKGAAGKKANKGKIIKASPGINPAIDIYPQATLLLTLESKVDGLLRVYEDTISCGEKERILLILFPPRFPGSLDIGSKIISFPIKELEEEKATEESAPPTTP
jgi:hypothetical protein